MGLTIIGENSFTRGVLRLLNPQQQEEIMKLTRMTMIDRRETFIRSNKTSVPRLKLSLQELFTETVLRHTRGQVGLEKENVGNRITELDNLSQQVAHKLAARDDAVNELSSSIRAAHAGIDALHKRVTQFLDDIDDDELHVGTTEHTMTMLGEILNDIVKRNAIALPSIIPEERGENDAQELYQSHYNQIPEDVKVLFSEAEKLCFGAQQAKHEESAAIGDYTLTTKRLEIAAQQGLKQHEAQQKLKELVEFEDLIRIIMLEGTFWAYYKVKPPGDTDRIESDEATQKQTLEELDKMTKDLSNACYWKNQRALGKMVKMAKDYVAKVRRNLTSYANPAKLTTAIIYAESSITSCEDVIARETARTRRTSSQDTALSTTGCPSTTALSNTHSRTGARKSGHNTDRDIPDFMDKIAKIQHDATHAPLKSTLAGEHAVSKSMVPISAYIGEPDGGDDYPSDDDSDYDDDDSGGC